MKSFRNINIGSNGSLNFYNKLIKTKTFFSFQLYDDKSFSFNKKQKKISIDSKHLLNYKKKYF